MLSMSSILSLPHPSIPASSLPPHPSLLSNSSPNNDDNGNGDGNNNNGDKKGKRKIWSLSNSSYLDVCKLSTPSHPVCQIPNCTRSHDILGYLKGKEWLDGLCRVTGCRFGYRCCWKHADYCESFIIVLLICLLYVNPNPTYHK